MKVVQKSLNYKTFTLSKLLLYINKYDLCAVFSFLSNPIKLFLQCESLTLENKT